jgi:hypothetical protein
MDLFSCRNCVQNPVQGLCSGGGEGYCLKWSSIIRQPEGTTCKYHHRKDLPQFLIEDATKEHAAEFSVISGIANLHTKQRIDPVRYSEKHAWETHHYDPQLSAVAAYHRQSDDDDEEGSQKWRVIQAFGGSVDGRKALGFASLVRRYMNHCGNWWSSYRFMLGIIEEIDYDVFFRSDDIKGENYATEDEMREQATWEVFFTRISGVQEFGWHASIEALKYPMTELYGYIGDKWDKLKPALRDAKQSWTETVIELAKNEGRFFPRPSDTARW